MSGVLALVVAVGLLIAFIGMSVPVGNALLAAGLIGLFLSEGAAFTGSTVGRVAFATLSSTTLIVVPMFILMGMFAQYGRISRDAFDIAVRVTRGRLPGGLGIASVIACAGFAAVSGSSIATVGSIGRVAMHEMSRVGYRLRFAAGIVASAGTLGILIPPSLLLVIYAITAGLPVGPMLVAGIVPGLISTVLYAAWIAWKAFRNPDWVGAELSDGSRDSFRDRSKATDASSRSAEDGSFPLAGAVQIAVLFVAVIGGIYLGVMTPVEAAAVGASIALGFLAWDSRKSPRGLVAQVRSAVLDSVEITSMALWLVVGAALFTALVVLSGVPDTLVDVVGDLPLPPTIVVVLLLIAFVPLGMFLDGLSIVLITVPLAHPIAISLGFDGMWFGILVVKMVEIGLVTPPLGINAFVVAGTHPKLTSEDAFRGIFTMLPADLLTIAIIFFVPATVTWLPANVS